MNGNHQSIADDLLRRLKLWGAYLYHEATTGSIYIKFPHWGLGSIRIGDHPGRKCYAYRWRVRTDKEAGHRQCYMHKGILVTECGSGTLDWLVDQFCRSAEARKIKPGDEAVWVSPAQNRHRR